MCIYIYIYVHTYIQYICIQCMYTSTQNYMTEELYLLFSCLFMLPFFLFFIFFCTAEGKKRKVIIIRWENRCFFFSSCVQILRVFSRRLHFLFFSVCVVFGKLWGGLVLWCSLVRRCGGTENRAYLGNLRQPLTQKDCSAAIFVRRLRRPRGNLKMKLEACCSQWTQCVMLFSSMMSLVAIL